MPRSAQSAALACASLWIVHTVNCAAFGRKLLSGPLTPEGEPSPADAVEGRLLFEYATNLTQLLHERARKLGLDPREVEAGREAIEAQSWAHNVADYPAALRYVGGRLI